MKTEVDGFAIDVAPVTNGQFLAFIDDVQSGALQMLTAINEDFAMRYVREFLQDVGSSPDYQRNAALQGIASQAQQIVEGVV